MLVASLSPKVVLASMAVLGSGVALVAVLGTRAPVYVWMGVVLWASVTTIALLARRANPVRQVVYVQPSPRPQRAHAEILAARPRELEAAPSEVTYTVTQQRAVR